MAVDNEVSLANEAQSLSEMLYYSHLKMAIIKGKEYQTLARMWRKKEPLYIAGGTIS